MKSIPNEFELKWINLAAQKLGSAVLYATDDFFAEKENLIKPEPPIFVADRYTENGKWMDGWESRRKRESGHDFVILKLGLPGVIHGFNIDTSHFTGNHPPEASVEACCQPGETEIRQLELAEWTEILPKSPLGPGQHNLFACYSEEVFTHIRLRIYPDGGVARLRVYGRADQSTAKSATGEIDLACVTNGGLVLECNDMYFSPKDNMIMPYEPEGMFDGWETRRRRDPGHDWSILSLGARAKLSRIELDTAFFKGNYPASCSFDCAFLENDNELANAKWKELMAKTNLQPDHLHVFEQAVLRENGPISHVRLNIYPDGGVARLRCIGEVC